MHRYVFRWALYALIGSLTVGAIALQAGLGRTTRASGETVNVWLTTPDQLMTKLFDPNNGIGLDFLRQPIGASGLALNEYTYDDVPSGQTDPNLNNFSIAHDTTYIIPLLQQALQLNPNLKIMATPWTAPAWMKSNDSLEQGSLNSSDYQVYAQYLVDFIQAYQAQGIPIYVLTPQNEPQNNNQMPSVPMSASDEANFIANYLGPTFAQNGIATHILAFDHNWDMSDYPTTILNNGTGYQRNVRIGHQNRAGLLVADRTSYVICRMLLT